MRDEIAAILALQPSFSADNTPAMAQRGLLVRQGLPRSLAALQTPLLQRLKIDAADLAFEGRDGTGRKTAIPWVRVYSRSRSPSAQACWYCVYLFHPSGRGVYLALAHGSTRFQNGAFEPRSDSELAGLVSWARGIVASNGGTPPNSSFEIDLDQTASRLAEPYRKSTAIARWYDVGDLPTEAELAEDLLGYASLLGLLYEAQDLGRVPGEEAPEVAEVESAVEMAVSGRRKGQGRGLSGPERLVVELRAMAVARATLAAAGWHLEDTSASRPYDFIATRKGEKVIVEVKGTTGLPGRILLTANEVEAHNRAFPNNMLIVVHGIDLVKGQVPKATGGEVLLSQPWKIHPRGLRPLAFEYGFDPNDFR